MSPSEYVSTYLNLPAPFGGSQVVKASLRNYLQSGLGLQSVRAEAAKSRLFSALTARLGIRGNYPPVFTFENTEIVTKSIMRVFMGKGAPGEIQATLWMASRCELVDRGSISSYCDGNLGIDCGGFVANYWGIGRPTPGDDHPVGWSGLKPRYIWHTNRAFRRADPSEIRVGDGVVCFRGVRKDNPDQALTRHSYGSEAFHIGLVSSIAPGSSDSSIRLRIAESSGAMRSDGGNGVNVRDAGEVELKVARSLVYYENGDHTERSYFVGPSRQPSAYEADYNPKA
jgi:hypothetical protein